ncbi:type IV secretion system protein [Gymnodinialimonas sp. 2305UL16-5]|uniref:virB8 family protein n=1 Tax=Gymnodinialimonas mytili TaxID=3126503 RepID=UPI0030AD2335
MSDDRQILLDAEVIYGAMRREKTWQLLFVGMTVATILAVASATLVMVSMRPPAPVVVPFDPETGMAVPNASVEAVSLDEQEAVVQSLVFRYVMDRETYNQLDNDIRISRALARSTGVARAGLMRQWDSRSGEFLPDRYGDRTQVNTVVTSITILDGSRVHVRMRKTLRSPDGVTGGNFTAVLAYEFSPGEERTLEAVWQNPLGFTVTDYSLFQDRRE